MLERLYLSRRPAKWCWLSYAKNNCLHFAKFKYEYGKFNGVCLRIQMYIFDLFPSVSITRGLGGCRCGQRAWRLGCCSCCGRRGRRGCRRWSTRRLCCCGRRRPLLTLGWPFVAFVVVDRPCGHGVSGHPAWRAPVDHGRVVRLGWSIGPVKQHHLIDPSKAILGKSK